MIYVIDIDNTISPFNQIGHETMPFFVPNPNPSNLYQLVQNTDQVSEVLSLIHEVQLKYTKIPKPVINTLDYIFRKLPPTEIHIVTHRKDEWYRLTLEWLRKRFPFKINKLVLLTNKERIKYCINLTQKDKVILLDDNPDVLKECLYKINDTSFQVIPVVWKYNQTFANRYKSRIKTKPDFSFYQLEDFDKFPFLRNKQG